MLLTAFLFLFKNNILSQNLINNGSFETYSVSAFGCAYNFSMVDVWQQINSPDHFTSLCTLSNYGVPNNNFGVSYPKNGNAYCGIICYRKSDEIKEYIQQNLIPPLISGKTYYISFYVSSSDRFTMAIKNIGAYFSISQPTVVPGDNYVQAIPQVENHSGFLTDTVNWVKIEGYFTAQGGEQYVTIGNFNSNTNTDTLYTGSNDPAPGNPDGAYYYIDSVSLYDSLDYVTNIKKYENDFKVNLYPNPNNGNMTLDYDLGASSNGIMYISDITGKLISTYSLQNSRGKLNINEHDFENGVYFYSIYVYDKTLKTDKVVIIK